MDIRAPGGHRDSAAQSLTTMRAQTLLLASLSAWSLAAAGSVEAQNVTQLPTSLGDMSGMNVQAPFRRGPSFLDKEFVNNAALAGEGVCGQDPAHPASAPSDPAVPAARPLISP